MLCEQAAIDQDRKRRFEISQHLADNLSGNRAVVVSLPEHSGSLCITVKFNGLSYLPDLDTRSARFTESLFLPEDGRDIRPFSS